MDNLLLCDRIDAVWKRGTFWVVVVLVVIGVFPWVPTALRWPARIFIAVGTVIAVGLSCRALLALWRNPGPTSARFAGSWLVLAVMGIAAYLLYPEWSFRMILRDHGLGDSVPASAPATAYVKELDLELKKRGIGLVVLAMPYYRHMEGMPASEARVTIPPEREVDAAREAMRRMKASGIPCIDLFEVFEKEASSGTDWLDDGRHLTIEAQGRVAEGMGALLSGLGAEPEEGERHPVFMGECFARQFGEHLRSGNPAWSALRIVHSFGDRGRVAEQLFLFPEEHLDGTGSVYWLMSYHLLSSPSFPPLKTSFAAVSDATQSATVVVESSLGWRKSGSREKLATLPYPDALVEIEGRVAESADLPEGSRIVLMNFGIRGRRLEYLGRVRPGDVIKAKFIPYEAQVQAKPEIASQYVVTKGASYDLERYWIVEWTKIGDEKGNEESEEEEENSAGVEEGG